MFRNQSPLRRATRRRGANAWRGAANMQCALLEVASTRYGIFRKKFGRDPEPDEPLFFDPNCDYPVPADRSEMREQVISAARAAQINTRHLLKFLGLN